MEEAYTYIDLISLDRIKLIDNNPTKLIIVPFGKYFSFGSEDRFLNDYFADFIEKSMDVAGVHVKALESLSEELRTNFLAHQYVLEYLQSLLNTYTKPIYKNLHSVIIGETEDCYKMFDQKNKVYFDYPKIPGKLLKTES